MHKHISPVKVVSAVTVLAVLSVAAVLMLTAKKTGDQFVSPRVSGITEAVDTTGTVKAANAVDLSFEI